MNLNNNPTIEQFRALLREHDDQAGHHALWVRKDGEVMLTCLPRGRLTEEIVFEHPDLQMRYDIFPVGYEYVGEEAAEDKWWTSELFRNLLERWAGAKGTEGITHIKLHTVAPYGQPVDDEERAALKREREEFKRRKAQLRCHQPAKQ